MTRSGGMLVAAPERWDEACFAVPSVRALAASGVGVGILCQVEQQAFWSSLHDIEVIGFPAKAKPKATAAALSGNWQASLTWDTGHAADAFKIAAIPRRLGPPDRKLAKLLTHPLKATSGPLDHRVRHYLATVAELGMPTAVPDFFAPAVVGPDPAASAVLLCPDSDFGPNHEWQFDRWVDVAKRILTSGRPVVVTGIPRGRDLGRKLAERLGDEVSFSPLAAFGESLPFLSAHGLVIAADSSLPHLAAHAGATCVTLFGPNDPAWKRPLGTRHTVVRRHVECAPCLLPKCPMDLRCQNDLDVERVWSAIEDKL